MIGVQPRRIKPGGTVMAVALTDPDQVSLLVRREQGAGGLVGLDLAGDVRWRLDLPGPVNYPLSVPRRQLRIAADSSVWLGEGRTLTQVGPNGRPLASLEVAAEPGEELGSFLVVPDGFVAAFHRSSATKGQGRVTRLDTAGGVVWSTILPAGPVAYSGVVEMGVDSGWQPRPKRAWRPRDWQPARRGEPLLLAGDRLLSRYFELASGLGRSFCLDWTTGRASWVTGPRPEASVVLVGADAFLVGVQGYGAFDLYLYDRDGQERQHWPSHAEVVVTESGGIRGVEMENCLPSRMHFSAFEWGGTVRKGPHLDDYYTTYPVVNAEGVAAFWRHGKLWTVDGELQGRVLWEGEGLADKAIMTRMLLAGDGTLIFGLEDELFLVPTDLGPMADSPWPCGGGNARGNPAFP
jgi:hypothetical protein